MLAFGNKEFRNLQEQVLKNMRDIQDLEQGVTVLADFGIKVVGQVDEASELPSPSTYEGDYGDAYIVGTQAPYEYYIFTRAFEGQEEPTWFNLGIFPQPGPQGPKGDKGDKGEDATVRATASATTLSPGSQASVEVINAGTDTNRVVTFTFGIPQGVQGIQGAQGPKGDTGDTGPQGPRGEKGESGNLYTIVGQVDSENDLPSPENVSRTSAYLVGTQEPYNVYVIIGTTNLEWINLGPIATTKTNTYLFSTDYQEQGSITQIMMNDIANEDGGYFIKVGNIIFVFSEKVGSTYRYIAFGKDGNETQFAMLSLNASTLNWRVIVTYLVKNYGTYPELIAGQAAQISSTLPNTHKEDFVFQTSAGSADIGSGVAEIQSLNGYSYVKNQLCKTMNESLTRLGITYTWDGTDVIVNGTATDISYYNIGNNGAAWDPWPEGHKILTLGCPVGGSNSTYFLKEGWNSTNSERDYGAGVISTSTTKVVAQIIIMPGTTVNNLRFRPQLIDLTLMFGAGNEPTTVDEYYARVGMDYIPYNIGEIVDSILTSYTTVGYNQWDEETQLVGGGTQISNKNPIRVIPGATYYAYCGTNASAYLKPNFYDKDLNLVGTLNSIHNSTFTIPSNACYMNFYMNVDYGTTYNHDICIFLYWDGSRIGYEQYDKHTYPLPGIKLLSAPANNAIVARGGVYDELKPDGTLIRRVNQLKLKNLSFTKATSFEGKNVYNAALTGANTAINVDGAPGLCSYGGWQYNVNTGAWTTINDKAVWVYDSLIYIRDDSLATLADFIQFCTDNDITINYRLKTEKDPIDSGATYQSNTIIDDFGTQEFNMPGSMTVKYPVNLQGFLETLYSLTSGDPSAIQLIG